MQKQNRKGKQLIRREVSSRPGVFKSEYVLTRKVRFQATGALSGVSLGIREIASGVAGVVATSTTTCNIIATAIRLKRVECWFTAATAGTPVEAVIDWNSGLGAGYTYAPGSSVSETSTSTAEYAHLVSHPPPNSFSDMWHAADDTSSAVQLTLPSGGIVDFTIDYVLNDSNTGVAGSSIAGGTNGLIYHKKPDTNLVVQGALNSI